MRREVTQEPRERCAGHGVGCERGRGGEGRGGRGMVSQVRLNEAQVHTCLQPMRGLAMPYRVHRGARVEAAGLRGGAPGVLDAVARPGCGGRGHPKTAPARRRQKPHRVAVGFPGLAERREERRWQGPRAIVGACATASLDDHPCASNSRDRQGGAFLQSEAPGVERAQTDAIPREPYALAYGVSFLHTEESRELALLRRPHEGQGRPGLVEGLFVEERDPAQRHRAGAVGGVLDMREGEDVLTSFFFCHVLRGCVRVFGALPHGPDIHLLGPLRHPSALETLNHPLAPWGQGSPSCTGGVMDGDVQEGESLYAVWHILQDWLGRRVGKKTARSASFNNALQLTARSLRFFVASASGSS